MAIINSSYHVSKGPNLGYDEYRFLPQDHTHVLTGYAIQTTHEPLTALMTTNEALGYLEYRVALNDDKDAGSGGEVNVQSDWEQTINTEDDFIKNKPNILDSESVLGTLLAGYGIASSSSALLVSDAIIEAFGKLEYRVLQNDGKVSDINHDSWRGIVDDLTTGGAAVSLSAAQGVALKGFIDTINTLLTSDNVNLDELQEVVDFIEANKSTLDALGISNIAGLQTALDGKLSTTGKAADSEKIDNYNSTELFKDNDVIMNTNPFGGRSLYRSSLNNPLFLADTRWIVSTDGGSNPGNAFNGNYEDGYIISAGETKTITIEFGDYNGYPYGDIYLSFYYSNQPETVVGRVYNTYEPHTIGWSDLSFVDVVNETGQRIMKARQGKYGLKTIEITLTAPVGNAITMTAVELVLDRPGTQEMPVLNKFRPQTLYKDTNWVGGLPKVDGVNVILEDDTRLSDARNAADVYAWAKATVKPAMVKSEIEAVLIGELSSHSHASDNTWRGIVDDLTTGGAAVSLSAAQGVALKGYIDAINTLLSSDEVTLDTLQEVVNYIETNRDTLDTLAIANITGLQTALDGKVDDGQVLTDVPAGASFTDTVYTLTKAKIEAELIGAITTHTHAYLADNHDASAVTATLITAWNLAKSHADSAHAPSGAEANVQSDWNETVGDALILNKPTAHPIAFITGLESALEGKVDDSTLDNYMLGADILANYEPKFSKETAFNKPFGVLVNTLIHGNDTRLSDARNAADVYAWAKATVKPAMVKSEIEAVLIGELSSHSHASDNTWRGIVDDLTTGGAAVSLSAAQGVALKGYIDAINTLLSSDEVTLDTLQEVVNYIETNRDTLDTLAIANITGLQTALDGKVDDGQVLTDVPAGASFTDTVYTLTKAKIEAELIGAITTHTHAYLADNHDASAVTATLITAWNLAKSHADSAHAPSGAEANVQSDWNETVGDALILNKPTAHPIAFITGLESALEGKVDDSTLDNYMLGADILANYEPKFSKETAFNKPFGVLVNTLIHGNDTRLSDARNAADVYAWAKATVKPAMVKSEIEAVLIGELSSHSHASDNTWRGIVDDLTTGGAAVSLSAAQGVALKGYIDAINTLLSSDEVTLDTLQEVVNYIETNRDTLDTLAIANITGLQTALDGKVDDGQVLTDVPAGASFTDTVYTLTKAKIEAELIGAITTHTHAYLADDSDYVKISETNLGKTGSVPLVTLSSETDWGDMPVGKMVMCNSTSTGKPSWFTSYFYVVMTGKRDMSGGYGVIAIDYATGEIVAGKASDTTVYPTWQRMLKYREIDDSPVNGETAESISSNWAYDHNAGLGNEKHVPATGTPGHFLKHDGTFGLPSYIPNSYASFQLEDGDGTEVAITNGNEVKFVEGGGIDINWTDVTPGSDADPFDLTFKVTGIEETNDSDILKLWYGTEAEYTAISTKDTNTLYITT